MNGDGEPMGFICGDCRDGSCPGCRGAHQRDINERARFPRVTLPAPDASDSARNAPVSDEPPSARVLTHDDPPAPALLPDPRTTTEVPF